VFPPLSQFTAFGSRHGVNGRIGRPQPERPSHDVASIALDGREKGKEAVAASASFGNQAAWAAAPHAFLGNSQGSGPASLGIPRFGGSSSAVVNQRTGDGSSGQEAARVRPRGAGSDAAGARVCSGEPGLSRPLRFPLAATAWRCIGANVAGALPQAFHGRAGFLGGLGGTSLVVGTRWSFRSKDAGSPCHSERGCVGGDPSF
jgi:hypothetical protein